MRATLTFSFGFIHDQFHSYTVERKKIYSVVGLERKKIFFLFFCSLSMHIWTEEASCHWPWNKRGSYSFWVARIYVVSTLTTCCQSKEGGWTKKKPKECIVSEWTYAAFCLWAVRMNTRAKEKRAQLEDHSPSSIDIRRKKESLLFWVAYSVAMALRSQVVPRKGQKKEDARGTW